MKKYFYLVTLLICFATVIFIHCRSVRTGARSQLKEFSLSKTFYTGEVTEGTLYVNSNYLLSGSSGTYGTPYPTPVYSEPYNSPNSEGSTSTLTYEERVQAVRAKIFTMTPQDISSQFSEIIQAQLYFIMRQIEKAGAFIAFNKAVISEVSVPEQQTQLPGAEMAQHVAIKYSVKFPLQYPNNMTPPESLQFLVPKSGDYYYLETLFKKYKTCVDPSAQHVTTDNFFYYVDFTKCDFAKLNENEADFYKTSIRFFSSKISDGGTPEYDRIWEDNRLVATIIFGKYDAADKNDIGVSQFKQFYHDIKQLPTIELTSEANMGEFNKRLKFHYKNRPGLPDVYAKRELDLQILHISAISKIDPETASLVMGDRIGPSDFFAYNGHSGYGNNIEYIEKLIIPNPNQYVLYFLNGCWTYGYTKLDNKNFDVLMNMQSTYFVDMAQASLSVIKGLLVDAPYKDILAGIPGRQEAVVAGEDVKSCPVTE